MKKRMFLSTILMTLVLLVAVTTATFAWYSATASANSSKTTSVNVSTQASELAQGAYYLRVEYKGGALNPVDATAPDGKCYMLSNDVIVAATAAGNTSDKVAAGNDGANYEIKVYSDAECKTEVTGADLTNALKSIGNKIYTVTATPTAQVRLSLDAAGTTDHELDVYTAGLLAPIEIGTCTIDGGNGTIELSDMVDFYYSVSGNSGSTQPVVGKADATSVATPSGTIVFGLVVIA